MNNFFKKTGTLVKRFFLFPLSIIKSFFYRGDDFQPIYFWVSIIMYFIIRMLYLRIEEARIDINDMLIISAIGSVVTLLGIYNWDKIKNPKHVSDKAKEIIDRLKQKVAE